MSEDATALFCITELTEVPQRKAKIVFALLKRHGLVREHRGGRWQRLQGNLTSCDLSNDLTDYEERRARDQAKLRSMVGFCQTAQCRTRYVLEHFGERRFARERLHQAGVAQRATFIVDPQGVIRFAYVTDLNVGRSPEEVLRVLDALQTDELCPCNWKKGEDTLKAA